MSLDLPVLRIRADGPVGTDVTELRLGDCDLLKLGTVTAIQLHVGYNEATTATLTVEVTPDIELPADLTVQPPPLELPEVQDLRRLELHDDEALIVRTKGIISAAMAHDIKDRLRATLNLPPATRIAVLSDMGLDVLRLADVQA